MNKFKLSDNEWDSVAKKLEEEWGESLISDESADENNPYDYWLQDMTVEDVINFLKNYKDTE